MRKSKWIAGVLRKIMPVAPPIVTALPHEELAWPKVETGALAIGVVEKPEISPHLGVTQVVSREFAEIVLPSVLEHDAYLVPGFEILSLIAALSQPSVLGTIFVKKEEEIRQGGEVRIRVKIAPSRLGRLFEPNDSPGLDVFELLLPILMPPAATEFSQELLFPEELYPYQRAGVKWLFERDSALLADDMGLGKTVQAITAFRALIRRGFALQALVVCPKSVLPNWMRELDKWAPELMAIRIHGSQQTREHSWRAYIGKCHVLVTTYDTVRQDDGLVKGRPFDLIVADEVQRVKNPETATSRIVRSLKSKRRWALSGTPLENSLEDLIGVFGFVKPGLFNARAAQFLSPREARGHVQPYILRRRKKDALPDLPEKVLDTKWLELSEAQRRTYEKAEREGVTRLRESREVGLTHVLALIQRLKQICNFDPDTKESSKMEFLGEYLEEACAEDQKALVISQYVTTLKQVENAIERYKPLLYTGELTLAERVRLEQAFNTKDEHKVLLLSLRAGGLGLNLARANYVLHFDRWWNPAVERQAEDRTHRIGQKRAVFVTRLICQETIEEKIERLLEKKKVLFSQVIDELSDVKLEKILSEEELFGLFGLTPPRRAQPEAADKPQRSPNNAKKPSKAEVIRPEEPYSNLARLRTLLRECKGYLWWADVHFRVRGLEEIVVSIDPAVVTEVRILSGPANIDERAKHEFVRFQEELIRKGIKTDWRVLKGFAHDRYIITQTTCYNVPPIDSILRGSYGEMLETPNRPPFEEWWSRAVPLSGFTVV
jgi:superfamily II DNA or RNA helicase